LTGLRCSGADHDGCQAECQILWKDAWLTRVPADTPLSSRTQVCAAPPFVEPPQAADPDRTYVCQMTRLWEASHPLSRMDIRQDLRPLLSGDIGFGAFVLAMLTRAFNFAQRLRKGVGFPAMPPADASAAPAPRGTLPAVGQTVYVRSREEIANTLKNSRTRGLWFDRDMTRSCGQRVVVAKHVNRIIHEGTGKMVTFKTPVAILEDVPATGEFLHFNAQQEYSYWREDWLRPASEVSDTGPASTSSL
jgi:hypothetical protein